MSNEISSFLEVLFIFTNVLIVWLNPSCSIDVSSVTNSSWFYSRLSGTSLSYTSFFAASISYPPPIATVIMYAGSPHLQLGGPFQKLSNILFSLNLLLIFLLLCSETFTSFSLSQDNVKTLDSEKLSVHLFHLLPAPSQTSSQTACGHFQAGLQAVALWPWIIFPPSSYSSSLNPTYPFRASLSSHLPKASLWCWLCDSPSPMHLGSPSAHSPQLLHSFGFTLNCFWFLLLSHLGSDIEATQHKGYIFCCGGGPTTPSMGGCPCIHILTLH